MEHAVARDEVDRPAALRVSRTNHRRVAAATGLKETKVRWILRLPGATSAAAAGRCHVLPVLLPQNLAGVGIEGVQVVGDSRDIPDLFHTGLCRALADDEHRHERV